MIALFSCAAHKNYEEIAHWCYQAETAVNKKLHGKVYDGVKYLSAQFSFLNLVEGVPPRRQNDHTIILTVEIDQFDSARMIQNLLIALDAPVVPQELQADLRQAFLENGRLNSWGIYLS